MVQDGVADLVSDDGADVEVLVLEVLEERVVDDDALRTEEAGDV